MVCEARSIFGNTRHLVSIDFLMTTQELWHKTSVTMVTHWILVTAVERVVEQPHLPFVLLWYRMRAIIKHIMTK